MLVVSITTWLSSLASHFYSFLDQGPQSCLKRDLYLKGLYKPDRLKPAPYPEGASSRLVGCHSRPTIVFAKTRLARRQTSILSFASRSCISSSSSSMASAQRRSVSSLLAADAVYPPVTE
ncbi:hypothetical protein BKA56DRAFT_602603 [Ilyonectria sp. MPI-CAGE-AT-0026]|nr:hypothetical protein BKA56DRAFT_602603 [Ilyonectria sp. MPI-CAGE-AT-0026]